MTPCPRYCLKHCCKSAIFITINFVSLFVLLCILLLLSSSSLPYIVRNTIVYIYLLYYFGKYVDIYCDIHVY